MRNKFPFSISTAAFALAFIAQIAAVHAQTDTADSYSGELTGIWVGVQGSSEAMILTHSTEGELLGVNLAFRDDGLPGVWRILLGAAERDATGHRGQLLQYGGVGPEGDEDPDTRITYGVVSLAADTIVLQIESCEYASGIERACPIEIGAELLFARFD